MPLEGDEFITNGYCYSDNYRIFLGLLIGINLIVSFYTLIQAFECRKISTEYQESLWISAALLCIVQVWVMCLPILQLVGKMPTWLFLVKVCIVFFTSVSALLCVFVPKIGYLRKSWNEMNQDSSGDAALVTYEVDDDDDDSEDEAAGGTAAAAQQTPSGRPFQSVFR